MRRIALFLALLLAGPVCAQTSFNVWTPKGNIVANPPSVKLGNPSVIPGLTGSVLSGTVFAGWFGDAINGTLYYYESSDGLTSWTGYSGNPLTPASGNVYYPTVYLESGTYYLYACTTTFPGNGISVFTSTDRVTWTAQGSQIALGGAGSWDQGGVFQLNIVDNISGTWYAYYSGLNAARTVYGLGLVTSTDLIHWTKSLSNPIFPGNIGGANFQKVGNTYYMWAASPNPNAQIPNDPTYRYSAASPSGPWTQLTYQGTPVPVYYVATTAELNTGTGPPNGFAADTRYVAANGDVYIYYTFTLTGGAEQSINAAVTAGYTLAQLVATYEGVVNVPFSGLPQLNLETLSSDTFTRANANPIGGNWSPQVTGHTAQIVSNVAQSSTVAVPGDSYWNASSWANDQWVQVTVNNETSGSFLGASARLNTSGIATGYRALLSGGTGSSANLIIQREIAGTGTNILTLSGFTVSVGDTIMIATIGSSIMMYWQGNLIGIETDSNIASGSAGFEIEGVTSTSNSGINAWAAGSFRNAPSILFPAQIGGFLISSNKRQYKPLVFR